MTNKRNVIDYHHNKWNLFVKLWQVDETHCAHYGYYEKGVHSHKHSVLNMNDFIARRLGLNSKSGETKYVLDAGCGIGGTIVHLARQYPNIQFTGITIVPQHVKIANQFAKQNQTASNTEFLMQDYLDTNFSSNYFDAIFALESISYTPHTRTFIQEMYRILKPGGKLVVIDAFRTNIQFNPLLNNLYTLWCNGQAIPDLTLIQNFKSYLKLEGFIEIKDVDHTRNIRRSVIRGNLISAPYLFSAIARKIIRGKHYRLSDDPAFPLAVIILSSILGLKKCITYNEITAIKNK